MRVAALLLLLCACDRTDTDAQTPPASAPQLADVPKPAASVPRQPPTRPVTLADAQAKVVQHNRAVLKQLGDAVWTCDGAVKVLAPEHLHDAIARACRADRWSREILECAADENVVDHLACVESRMSAAQRSHLDRALGI